MEFFTFFSEKARNEGQKWTSYWDFLAEKAKISTKKRSRKIALKRRKRQLFETNLDRNLVKTANFWDKVRTMNFRSTECMGHANKFGAKCVRRAVSYLNLFAGFRLLSCVSRDRFFCAGRRAQCRSFFTIICCLNKSL